MYQQIFEPRTNERYEINRIKIIKLDLDMTTQTYEKKIKICCFVLTIILFRDIKKELHYFASACTYPWNS